MSNQQTRSDAPLRIAIVGYGRMGREVERVATENGAQVVERFDVDRPLADGTDQALDVAIEFTHPDAVVNNVRMLLERGLPVVIGTTGWNERVPDIQAAVAAHQGRLVYASNFSLGVLAFTKIVREAARLFAGLEHYDVAIHETHHSGKADAPSGTALSLAREILERIPRKTQLQTETTHERIAGSMLHVSSQRLGSVVGAHVVTFDSASDTIELVHRAKDRSGFALGAFLAARWIVNQPSGMYRFEDVF